MRRGRASREPERRSGGPAPSLSAARATSPVPQALTAGVCSAAASVLLLVLTVTFVSVTYAECFGKPVLGKALYGSLGFFPASCGVSCVLCSFPQLWVLGIVPL